MNTDRKGFHSIKWEHYYDLYDLHFPKPPAKVLEIGIGGGGNLLRMREQGYNVIGVDIEDIKIKDIPCLKADACSKPQMQQIARETGPFDVIIDDGGHRPYEIYCAFKTLWPALKEGGVYCIEDVHVCEKLRWRIWTKLGFPSLQTVLDEIRRMQHAPYIIDFEHAFRFCEVHTYPHIVFIVKKSWTIQPRISRFL